MNNFPASKSIPESRRSASSGGAHFVAGSIGGIAGVAIGYPFDTIRVRMQTSSFGTYSSATQCFVNTVQSEGIKGLYKGLSSPLVAATFLKAVTFGSYGYLLKFFESKRSTSRENLPMIDYFLAGVGSGIVNSLFSCPVDRAKIVLQVQKHTNNLLMNFYELFSSHSFSGPIDVAKKMGWFGMYKGYLATVSREMLGCGTYFLTYEFLRRQLTLENESNPRIGAMLLSGGLTGVTTWTVMFPLDTIKSKLQAKTFPTDSSTIIETIKQTWKEGGIKAFYKGWRPAVLRALPAHAAILGTFELTMKLLSNE